MVQRDAHQPDTPRAVDSATGTAPVAFSAREVADMLGVHERTIRRAIREGRLVASRRGRAFAITSEALEAYRVSWREQAGTAASRTRPLLRLVPSSHARATKRTTAPSRFGSGALGVIPRPLTSFVGREREIAALTRLIGEGTRLITLTGPGGVGKTRLAMAAAAGMSPEFEDGAVFVPLAAVSDPALVLGALARSLDVREIPGQPLLESLMAALHGRRALLVLDNFEHVRSAAVDVARLLEACPRVTAVVTSREPLRVSGEQRFLTSPLALPEPGARPAPELVADFDAIRLFVERARLVDREFVLTEESGETVVEICRRLDGLPLAIELAAAWVRVLPPSALLGQLEHRLPLLRSGGEDQPARLRTMTHAIAWSADRLSIEESRLFRRLGVFVGGFTLEAVEAVTVGTALHSGGGSRHATRSTLDVLTALVDKSLVQKTPSNGDEPRFMMLETVREFARERLADSGEGDAAAAAHVAWMKVLAEQAESHILGPHERSWQSRLDAELGNVRAALAWSLDRDVETALRIAASLWVYWSVDHIAEGRQWLMAALGRPSVATELVRARAMTTEAALACVLGDFAASEAAAGAAADLAERTGDRLWEARARWIIGAARVSTGQSDGVADTLDRSLALFAGAATASGRAHGALTGWLQGNLALMAGEVEHGFGTVDRALEQARASGSPSITTYILGDYAGWLVTLGHTARARLLLDEAIPLVARNPMNHAAWIALLGLALVNTVEGNAEFAARLLGAIVSALHRTGATNPAPFQARVDQTIARARQALGEAAFAAAWAAGSADPDGVIAAAIASAGEQMGDGMSRRQPLTPREVEVLRLVIAGQADKEIAATLSISRATASRHVGSIRAKLGAPSRSAVAAIAVRDNLV